MAKIKCNICKKGNNGTVCSRCGASIGDTATEELVLSAGGYVLYNDDKGKYVDKFSSCKVAMTNRRLVIYRIRPEAENPAWGLFKDLINLLTKNPYISIDFNNIESIRRYREWYTIKTKIGTYSVCMSKQEEFDKLFAPYKDQKSYRIFYGYY